MSLNENFKDTYVALNGDVVFIDAKTNLESENAVIGKTLSSLLSGEKLGAVSSIRFLPLGVGEKEKIVAAFGEVIEEKEDSYLLEVTKEYIAVYSDSLRGHLYGACTLRSHYRDGIKEGYIYNVPLVEFRAVKMYLPAEDKLELYDVVVYKQDDMYVIHRIVGIEEPNEQHPNERHFLLQGDAVDRPDTFPVLYSQMQGIYDGSRIPFIGSFVLFLQSPAGWLCVLLVIFSMVATPIVERKIKRETQKRVFAFTEQLQEEAKKEEREWAEV